MDALHRTLAEKLHDELSDRLEKTLSDSLVHRVFQARQVRDLAGVADIYEKLSVEGLAGEIAVATHVRIMQTWIPFLYEIVPSISMAINNQKRVDILLLNPDSDLAARRSKAMGYPNPEQVRKFILGNIDDLKYTVIDDPNVDHRSLEVRLYDTLPITCIYQLDDRIIFSLFLEKQRAHQIPHFVIAQRNTWLYTALRAHMDAVWSEAFQYDFDQASLGLDDNVTR
jgi:hypothetical protein